MTIHEYINQKKDIYTTLLKFIESETNEQDEFENFIKLIEAQKILENCKEFKALLFLIKNISKNHHRNLNFFKKIEQILSTFEEEIKHSFSNFEIFNIFKSNKRILLFLFNKKILILKKSIYNIIQHNHKYSYNYFEKYFKTEFEIFKDKQNQNAFEEEKEEEEECSVLDSNTFDNFEEKRQIGENDSYICQLIRNDSVDDFIIYINQANISFSSTIKHSIFETNSFLLKNKNTTLIEYATFFGSIQIFNYLLMNGVELKPSLWIFAMHSKNAEMINILESYKLQPEDLTFEKCLMESIKCHHNDIAYYIQENLLNESKKNSEEAIKSSIRYYNYDFFPTDFDHKFIYLSLCKYNYIKLIEILLKTTKLDIYDKTISEFLFYNDIYSQ